MDHQRSRSSLPYSVDSSSTSPGPLRIPSGLSKTNSDDEMQSFDFTSTGASDSVLLHRHGDDQKNHSTSGSLQLIWDDQEAAALANGGGSSSSSSIEGGGGGGTGSNLYWPRNASGMHFQDHHTVYFPLGDRDASGCYGSGLHDFYGHSSTVTAAAALAAANATVTGASVSHDPLSVGLNGSIQLSRHLDNDPFEMTSKAPVSPFSSNEAMESNLKHETESESESEDGRKKGSAAFRPRGRKKRNKCSPEQLRSLEAFFSNNRNPTGRVREELSKKLQMPERSVQVWFQNRRAKVKLLERRGVDPDDKSRNPGRVGEKSGSSEAKGGRPGKGDGPDSSTPSVTAFPTSALCVGSWRRVSPLICFFSRRLQSLTWYLTCDSIGFKLEIPWTSIKAAFFDGPTQPSMAERAEGVRVPLGHFTIDLERPPTFFMEVFRSGPTKEGAEEKEQKTSWRQCADFTEGRQATLVRRHVLNGPYEELREAVMALSKANDVLEKLVEFRDTEKRNSGLVPMGSNSTAENFGIDLSAVDGVGMSGGGGVGVGHGHGHGWTSISPSQQIVYDLPPPSSLHHHPHHPHYSHHDPSTMTTAGSRDWAATPLTTSSAWQEFRSPGGGSTWEFNSPASVTSSLSHTSIESVPISASSSHYGFQESHHHPSVHSSPRGNFDLDGLRIDTCGISSFGTSNLSMMGPSRSEGNLTLSSSNGGHGGGSVATASGGSGVSHHNGVDGNGGEGGGYSTHGGTSGGWENQTPDSAPANSGSLHWGAGGGHSGPSSHSPSVPNAADDSLGSLHSRSYSDHHDEGHHHHPHGQQQQQFVQALHSSAPQTRKLNSFDVDAFYSPTPTMRNPYIHHQHHHNHHHGGSVLKHSDHIHPALTNDLEATASVLTNDASDSLRSSEDRPNGNSTSMADTSILTTTLTMGGDAYESHCSSPLSQPPSPTK